MRKGHNNIIRSYNLYYGCLGFTVNCMQRPGFEWPFQCVPDHSDIFRRGTFA